LKSHWYKLEEEVRKMHLDALAALLGRLSPQGRAVFGKLYNDGIENIKTDGGFELAFDYAEALLKREGKDATTD
jgi:hypothetical protein